MFHSTDGTNTPDHDGTKLLKRAPELPYVVVRVQWDAAQDEVESEVVIARFETEELARLCSDALAKELPDEEAAAGIEYYPATVGGVWIYDV